MISAGASLFSHRSNNQLCLAPAVFRFANVGYTWNENSFLSKAKIASMRIYFSGTNLLLVSNFKLWDIEMGGNGLGYPIQKVFNMGINVSF